MRQSVADYAVEISRLPPGWALRGFYAGDGRTLKSNRLAQRLLSDIETFAGLFDPAPYCGQAARLHGATKWLAIQSCQWQRFHHDA